MRFFGKFLGVLLFLSLSLGICSCEGERVFEHCEMLLSLPKDYEEVSTDEPFVIYDSEGMPKVFTTSNSGSLDMAFSDERSVVALTRISKEAGYEDGIPPMLTQLDFASLYLQKSGTVAELKLHSDIPYYSYTVRDGEENAFSFLLTFYATPYSYFIATYITTEDRADSLLSDFLDIAESVGFQNSD